MAGKRIRRNDLMRRTKTGSAKIAPKVYSRRATQRNVQEHAGKKSAQCPEDSNWRHRSTWRSEPWQMLNAHWSSLDVARSVLMLLLQTTTSLGDAVPTHEIAAQARRSTAEHCHSGSGHCHTSS
mmetsp:Transcript_119331/g.337578  ORF Transcript_119331/g.337578 Transcript_119331/m.337578 type:complete len:124 (-) Transcript_119331:946-1317(-)